MMTRVRGTASMSGSVSAVQPRVRRRGGFIAVTELSVCLAVFAALVVTLAFLPGDSAATEAASPGEFQAIRRLAAVGSDGSQVAVLTDYSCRVHDLVRGEASSVWVRVGDERVTAIAGRPVSRHLAVGNGEGEIRVVEAGSGGLLWERSVGDGPVQSAVFSPDGQTLAVGTGRAEVVLLDAETGAERHRITTGAEVRAVAFTACGERVIVPAAGGDLSILNVSTAAEVRRIAAVSGSVVAMAVRPDGECVAVTGDQGEVVVVGLTESARTERLMASGVPVLAIGYSAEGERLLVGAFERSIRVYSGDGAREIGTLKGHRFGTRTFLPTEAGLLSAGLDGRVVAWDLARGEGRDVLTY